MTVKIGYTKTSQVVIACLLSFLTLATLVIAAAPTSRSTWINIGDYTVTAQSATVKDSCIAVASDSAQVLITATGTAVFDRAGESLTVGLGNTYSNHNTANLETCTYTNPRGTTGTTKLPFTFRWVVQTTGALTDTFYLQTYCGGLGGSQSVDIEDLQLTSIVTDYL